MRVSRVVAPPPRGESWPEFDRWQAAFAAADAFPPRWDGLHVAPPTDTPEATAYRLRKLVLLSEWLEMLARRSTVHLHYSRRGIKVRAVRQDGARACPGCDPFDGQELDGRADALPPFHPGCRCVLVAVPAVTVVRPPDHSRPRTR